MIFAPCHVLHNVSNPLKIEMSRDSRVYIFPDFLLRDVAGDVSGPDPPEDLANQPLQQPD